MTGSGIWASAKVGEYYSEVELEDEGRVSIAQDILCKSTDFLREIIGPSYGVGGVTLPSVCLHCHRFPLEDYIWWVSSRRRQQEEKRSNAIGGVQLAVASSIGGPRVLVIQDSTHHRIAKVLRSPAALFFFLLQKEPATEQVGETLVPSSMLTSVPSSPLMFSRIVRSSLCT